ncbi:hypothetical protein NLI96_g13325 [Meripilus lineatus]|uniref:Uncharacterized protein n=1 Tax=Meripilus lineatus TaxID=2056292 RepID=A0AAD5USY8_9APHY|nr:hypothetical protein NLI96_g13325 [Physisporinus lineatus]
MPDSRPSPFHHRPSSILDYPSPVLDSPFSTFYRRLSIHLSILETRHSTLENPPLIDAFKDLAKSSEVMDARSSFLNRGPCLSLSGNLRFGLIWSQTEQNRGQTLNPSVSKEIQIEGYSSNTGKLSHTSWLWNGDTIVVVDL